MTRLFNDPAAFADEFAAGFAAANPQRVRRVRGGVVRADNEAGAPGTVGVVTGGGSGHYPAFAGLVGPGLTDGAVMGNIFASPSARQVCSVARAVDRGAGVLLTFGNYAGDVLQFGLAQDRLRAEGMACETVIVTDDISSAPTSEISRRRGIAGDLVVFKCAGAAAAAGLSLPQVAELAAHGNARTRSFGVAFTGCTLPGADEPLFTVPPGLMGVGMGIHGEPGISEDAVPSADELAELLVERLLAEAPGDVDTTKVAVILNGLGAVKYEELFVVYRRVAGLLDAAGVHVVDPEVGELVTSLDMAGVSLTLCWLDDDLERLWRAPADAPAYRKKQTTSPPRNAGSAGAPRLRPPEEADAPERRPVPNASDRSRRTTSQVVQCLMAVRETLEQHADELGKIDAIAGDGDHGIGMLRGATAAGAAAREALARDAGAGTALAWAADAWADRAGGTSGALWGVILHCIAQHVGDAAAPTSRQISNAVADACRKVLELGGAQPGDKTMVDVLVPFAESLSANVDAGHGLLEAWTAANATAQQCAEETARMVPKMGRARSHTTRSVGTRDAGAVSLALITDTLRTAISTVNAEGAATT